MELDLSNIIKNKNTYPNWSTGSTYPLRFKDLGKDIEIYYIAEKNITKKRYSKIFPKHIDLTPGFCWTLGFIKAEGLNSINSHSYSQFHITNKNPEMLKKVIKELDKSGLLTKDKWPGKCFQIANAYGDEKEVIKYWSKALNVNINKFFIKRYKHELRKSYFGICHIVVGDVLLRRIIDLINEFIM